MRRHTYGYLPSRRASPPRDRYKILLLGDRLRAQLARGCWLKAKRPWIEPATFQFRVQRANHARVLVVGEKAASLMPGGRCVVVQAPASMKSVVLAGWLLTTAAGNLVDVVVSATRVISQVCSARNGALPVQLAQCWFPGLAVSSAKILIYFSNEIYGSDFFHYL